LRTDISDESFLNSLDSIETETVNEALKKILPDFVNITLCLTSDFLKVPNFEDKVIVLRTWRRKIKDWFKSLEKPETRNIPIIVVV